MGLQQFLELSNEEMLGRKKEKKGGGKKKRRKKKKKTLLTNLCSSRNNILSMRQITCKAFVVSVFKIQYSRKFLCVQFIRGILMPFCTKYAYRHYRDLKNMKTLKKHVQVEAN